MTMVVALQSHMTIYGFPARVQSVRRKEMMMNLLKSLRRQVESMAAEKPKVRTIGKYALAFEWASGCSAGIYRFERLWALANNQDPDGGRPYVHGAW